MQYYAMRCNLRIYWIECSCFSPSVIQHTVYISNNMVHGSCSFKKIKENVDRNDNWSKRDTPYWIVINPQKEREREGVDTHFNSDHDDSAYDNNGNIYVNVISMKKHLCERCRNCHRAYISMWKFILFSAIINFSFDFAFSFFLSQHIQFTNFGYFQTSTKVKHTNPQQTRTLNTFLNYFIPFSRLMMKFNFFFFYASFARSIDMNECGTNSIYHISPGATEWLTEKNWFLRNFSKEKSSYTPNRAHALQSTCFHLGTKSFSHGTICHTFLIKYHGNSYIFWVVSYSTLKENCRVQ